MLRMGFIDDVETILKETPAERQVVLFSATMPPAIKRITARYLKDPVEIKIKNKTSTVSTIKQLYWKGKTYMKLDVLTRILESDDFGAVIVFVRTKSMTVEISEKLEARGYASTPLNGDIKQDLREKTINRLKKGSLDIIVATDVVARGLDVERITHVINYDMPHDTESYVHRIGRTGRAGRKGTAILFIPPRGDRMLQSIERSTGQKIEPLKLPSQKDITDNRIARFKETVIEASKNQKLEFFDTLVSELKVESELSNAQIAAALAYIAQRERPLVDQKGAIPDFAFSSSDNGRNNRRDNDSRGDRGRDRKRKRKRNDRRDNADRSDRGRNDRNNNRDRNSSQQESPRRNPKNKSSEKKDDVPMTEYRIEVGKDHGAEARHIVGALINEAGLESQYIQNLKINSDHSIVKLPEGMPKDIYKHLHKTWVAGRQMKLRDLSSKSDRKPHSNNKKK